MEMLETDLFNHIENGVILKIESSDMEIVRQIISTSSGLTDEKIYGTT